MFQHIHALMQESEERNFGIFGQIENKVMLAGIDAQCAIYLR